MLSLGIDTSSAAGSVGIADNATFVAELNLRAASSHPERLIPSIHALFQASGLQPGQIDLLAVAAGPGCFTGLRIGMATAKGLALALGRPLVGFSTLETIAMAVASGLPGTTLEKHSVCVLLDAGRGEVYRGLYLCEDGRAKALAVEAALPPEMAVVVLPEGTVVCGDGVSAFHEPVVASLGRHALVLAGMPPIGSMLARRSLELAARNSLQRLPPMVPNYLRL